MVKEEEEVDGGSCNGGGNKGGNVGCNCVGFNGCVGDSGGGFGGDGGQ